MQSSLTLTSSSAAGRFIGRMGVECHPTGLPVAREEGATCCDRSAGVDLDAQAESGDRRVGSGDPRTPLLLIVDGHCYAYRAFYGISATLTSPGGKPTNAIYGFIRMLGKIRGRIKPTHTVVVWDGGLAAERMTLLPEYKAQRAEMPDRLVAQLDEMVAYLRAAGVCSLVKDGCEADDCIATLATQAAASGLAVVIASADKDFMQLVSEDVRLLVPQDRTESLWDADQVRQKTGVGPGQVVDWLSLVGDSSDNIPGVAGIGPKSAANLLMEFGSIDTLYARINEVKSERVRSRLEAARDTVRRNQQLIKLGTTVACGLRVEDMAARQGNREELSRLFSGWGFKKLLQDLQESPGTEDLFHEHSNVN